MSVYFSDFNTILPYIKNDKIYINKNVSISALNKNGESNIILLSQPPRKIRRKIESIFPYLALEKNVCLYSNEIAVPSYNIKAYEKIINGTQTKIGSELYSKKDLDDIENDTFITDYFTKKKQDEENQKQVHYDLNEYINTYTMYTLSYIALLATNNLKHLRTYLDGKIILSDEPAYNYYTRMILIGWLSYFGIDCIELTLENSLDYNKHCQQLITKILNNMFHVNLHYSNDKLVINKNNSLQNDFQRDSFQNDSLQSDSFQSGSLQSDSFSNSLLNETKPVFTSESELMLLDKFPLQYNEMKKDKVISILSIFDMSRINELLIPYIIDMGFISNELYCYLYDRCSHSKNDDEVILFDILAACGIFNFIFKYRRELSDINSGKVYINNDDDINNAALIKYVQLALARQAVSAKYIQDLFSFVMKLTSDTK